MLLSCASDETQVDRYAQRAMIEEQYAKRLTALAKAALGRDEIGYVLFI